MGKEFLNFLKRLIPAPSPSGFEPPAQRVWRGYVSQFAEKVYKSDEEWRKQLTPEQFEITRRKGTERPFTGKHFDSKNEGIYKCVCCGAELFVSDAKYDSGSGWPSFFAPIDENNLKTETDTSHGMLRTKVSCRRCGAHLGHVFPDSPEPTGLRYCINSLALNFEKRKGE